MRHGTARRRFRELWRDAHVDVWVISWGHGNDTGFHDHDVSSGAVAVVDGELIQERLVLGAAPGEVRPGADQVFDFYAAQVQRMRQDSFTPEASVQPTRRRSGAWAAL